MKNKKLFLQNMTLMGEIFGKDLSTSLTEAYWIALQPFDDEACKMAFRQLVVQSKFFPRPADIIDLMVVKNVDVAEVEATRVLKAIKTIGAYQSVTFEDPVTSAVIKDSFGGWIKLCGELTEAKESWFIKDFVRAYQAFAKQGITHEGQIPGIIERNNGAYGFEEKVPKAIPVSPKRDIRLLAAKIGES